MRGECFKTAAQELLASANGAGWLLCHGLATGQGGNALGKRYCHAWLEHRRDDVVWDPSVRVMMDKAQYYRLGQIQEHEVRRYTQAQTRQLALEHEHTGPWDDLFDDPGYFLQEAT